MVVFDKFCLLGIDIYRQYCYGYSCYSCDYVYYRCLCCLCGYYCYKS